MKARLLLYLLLVVTVSVQGQVTNNSVYSRFGLGELHDGISIKQRGMGGLAYGLNDPTVFNIKNPAALSFTRVPAFTLGLKYEIVEAENVDQKQTNMVGVFDHFALSFPIRQGKGGMAVGIIPYTSSGYLYNDTIPVPGGDNVSTINYQGDGGVNTMFLKGGYRFLTRRDTSEFGQNDYLGLGAGFKYYFGSLTNTKRAEFPRNMGLINTFVADRTTYSDIGFDFGFMYKAYLKKIKDKKDPLTVLNIGGSFQPTVQLNGVKSDDVFTYLQNSLGEQVVVDSISALRNQDGFAQLPSGFGVGMSLEMYRQGTNDKKTDYRRKIMLGVDYSANSWSQFQTSFLERADFAEITDNSNLAVGLSYLPNSGIGLSSTINYFQLCTYRAGFRAANLNMSLNNQQITETGIDLGMSLPLVRGIKDLSARSYIDLSVGYGQRGTTDNGLIKEDYLRIMVGLSLSPEGNWDKWFRKRKYD